MFNVKISLLIGSLLICSNPFCLSLSANTNKSVSPFQKIYTDIGYKSIGEATKDFELHFKRPLKLPLRIPSIAFTHTFGRFNDLEGETNDSFEAEFIHSSLSQHHYKIEVKPSSFKLSMKQVSIEKVYMLNNGHKAKYITDTPISNMLVFEQDGWQYLLCINKRVADKVSSEELVDIANSIY